MTTQEFNLSAFASTLRFRNRIFQYDRNTAAAIVTLQAKNQPERYFDMIQALSRIEKSLQDEITTEAAANALIENCKSVLIGAILRHELKTETLGYPRDAVQTAQDTCQSILEEAWRRGHANTGIIEVGRELFNGAIEQVPTFDYDAATP
tara:strand:+ start:90 stop:539 length:450 start_codon:yes stop_codon:yes gene_type:complete